MDSKSFRETLTSTIIAPMDYEELDTAETDEKRPRSERLGMLIVLTEIALVLGGLGYLWWRFW